LIFKGNYETITTALDKILDCKLYKDGIAIDRGTRQRLYYKYKGDQFLFALLFANLKNYGTDYGKIDKMELINRLHNDTNAFMKSSEEKQPEDVAHLTTRKGSLQTANNSQSSQIQGLAKVAGMKDLKKVLEKDVLGVLNNPELFQRYRLTIPNGILLYGPPGCGKTFIARQLAEELGYYFVEIIPSAVGSTYIHQTSLLIRDIFEKAAAKAPSVIFIDEFDALVPSRADLQSADQYKSEEVNEFLAHLNACAEKKIFVIAATNEPGKIDPAIKRTGRLDKLIYVGPPDLEARVEMLRLHLEGRPLEGDIEFSSIAKVLEGFSASDIKYLIDEAARDALAKGSPISTALIMEARNRVPPSVTKKDEERYKSFASRG
jgi:transitional endoplasmic reticulum ATPase